MRTIKLFSMQYFKKIRHAIIDENRTSKLLLNYMSFLHETLFLIREDTAIYDSTLTHVKDGDSMLSEVLTELGISSKTLPSCNHAPKLDELLCEVLI